MGWLRSGLSPHQTSIAMIGAKPGDRALVLGSHDPPLAAELALVTGLNGHLLVVDQAQGAAAKLQAAARRAGALVDFEEALVTNLPVESGSFDLAVIDRRLASLQGGERGACIAEALRAIRPGGRLIVLEGSQPPGFLAGTIPLGLLAPFRRPTPGLPAEEVLNLLAAAGLRTTRKLGEADGVTYYEARRPRD